MTVQVDKLRKKSLLAVDGCDTPETLQLIHQSWDLVDANHDPNIKHSDEYLRRTFSYFLAGYLRLCEDSYAYVVLFVTFFPDLAKERLRRKV